MPRTILLDLDGTLIDSRPGIAASCEAALRALGHTPDLSFDITPLIGPPLPQVISRVLERYGDYRVEAGVAAYRAHYGEIGLHQATIYPGIPDALRLLSASAKCFVVTSKRSVFATRIVESLGLADWCRGVYGTEPDGSLDDKRDLIAAVLRAEALAAGDTVMVGDRSHDMIGARANGVRGIGVLWGYGSREELEAAGADALLQKPEDLARLFAVTAPAAER
ncbi:MAG TPA: HAD hydrolase-like protein [Acetobacteraceae bacterium]|nr:HAD hydrolase-like protein [Acetobacteraceae bacterium]